MAENVFEELEKKMKKMVRKTENKPHVLPTRQRENKKSENLGALLKDLGREINKRQENAQTTQIISSNAVNRSEKLPQDINTAGFGKVTLDGLSSFIQQRKSDLQNNAVKSFGGGGNATGGFSGGGGSIEDLLKRVRKPSIKNIRENNDDTNISVRNTAKPNGKVDRDEVQEIAPRNTEDSILETIRDRLGNKIEEKIGQQQIKENDAGINADLENSFNKYIKTAMENFENSSKTELEKKRQEKSEGHFENVFEKIKSIQKIMESGDIDKGGSSKVDDPFLEGFTSTVDSFVKKVKGTFNDEESEIDEDVIDKIGTTMDALKEVFELNPAKIDDESSIAQQVYEYEYRDDAIEAALAAADPSIIAKGAESEEYFLYLQYVCKGVPDDREWYEKLFEALLTGEIPKEDINLPGLDTIEGMEEYLKKQGLTNDDLLYLQYLVGVGRDTQAIKRGEVYGNPLDFYAQFLRGFVVENTGFTLDETGIVNKNISKDEYRQQELDLKNKLDSNAAFHEEESNKIQEIKDMELDPDLIQEGEASEKYRMWAMNPYTIGPYKSIEGDAGIEKFEEIMIESGYATSDDLDRIKQLIAIGDDDGVELYFNMLKLQKSEKDIEGKQEILSDPNSNVFDQIGIRGGSALQTFFVSAAPKLGVLFDLVANLIDGNGDKPLSKYSNGYTGMQNQEAIKDLIGYGLDEDSQDMVGGGVELAGDILVKLLLGKYAPIVEIPVAMGESAYSAIEGGASVEEASLIGVGAGAASAVSGGIANKAVKYGLGDKADKLFGRLLENYTSTMIEDTFNDALEDVNGGNTAAFNQKIQEYLKENPGATIMEAEEYALLEITEEKLQENGKGIIGATVDAVAG